MAHYVIGGGLAIMSNPAGSVSWMGSFCNHDSKSEPGVNENNCLYAVGKDRFGTVTW